jgi:epoxide hydrolase
MQAWRQLAASQQEADEAGSDREAGPEKGVAVFAADTTIRSVMDPDGTIEHWSEFDRGGHFPAMETPDLLTNDLHDFFGKHR